MSNTDDLNPMRHSLAHIMASAVQKLWPQARFGVGPVIENGFYYDIDLGDTKLSKEDFKHIEGEMKRIIKEDQPFERSEKGIDEAIDWAKQNNQPYKEELLNDLKRAGTTVAKDLDAAELGLQAEGDSKIDSVSFYTNGDFCDLCRGPHVESTGKAGAFKLTKIAGAYWRGKDTNPQMQRLYGVAFATQEELDNYFKMLEEAKSRDHRKLGEDLQLFFMSDSVGAGLPLLMPRGELIKNELMRYMRTKEETRGYKYVSTPVLASKKLYERSGHADYYLENMYGTAPDEEGNIFYIKPMNCPHHHMIYEKLVNSYRDLPLRLSEHAGLYRYELSGTLTGLIRMRGPITQNDSHTYITKEQVKDEFVNVLQLFQEVYAETGVKDYWFRLSLPDFSKEKYAGSREHWEWAGDVISQSLKDVQADFVEELDEAAFYGPKVDVQIRNVMGKEDSIATVQLDIVVPERMGLTYIDANNSDQYVYVIHKSIMGAFERFMAFLLEQTAGKLPVWLSPEQLRVVTLNDDDTILKMAKSVVEKAIELGLRAELDNSNESVGKKIRNAEVMKVPYTVVIGGKEVESGQVTPRVRNDLPKLDPESLDLDDFLNKISDDAKNRK